MDYEKLTKKLKNEGIIHLKSVIDINLLKKLEDECDTIVSNARKGQIKQIRIYRNYFGLKYLNIFGIDFPFNKEISRKLFSYFNLINIKKDLLKIFDWEDFNTSVVRLHTNSNFFKYQGEWHRDDDKYPSPNSYQCIIYLKNEKGFRIVNKINNKDLLTYGFNIYGNEGNKEHGFVSLPSKMYYEVDAKRGDIVIFESGLLHQGFVKGERLHLHLRFLKCKTKEENINNIFNVTRNLQIDYDLNNEKINHNYLEKNVKTSLVKIKNLILYFFPRVKYIYKNLFSKSKSTVFHSTFWQ